LQRCQFQNDKAAVLCNMLESGDIIKIEIEKFPRNIYTSNAFLVFCIVKFFSGFQNPWLTVVLKVNLHI
jgi:hypothetical protein